MLRDTLREADPLIALSELYESVQGEGLLVGTPAVFIRLKGCNLRCPWCDQPEALPFGEKTVKLSELIKRARSLTPRHAVVTGGEPVAHPELPRLVKALTDAGFSVQIETNGTLWQEELARYKLILSVSPKAQARYEVRPEVLKRAFELKFVVDEELSFEVLKKTAFRPFFLKERVVLQPESNRPEMARKAFELQKKLLKEGLKARLIPQAHKCLALP
ncbi:MAG: 7-carboxy-7-deazaguanine synthase QueE [Aquificae bacterium]|nr:7-carboxy-7-deazaguanine synthase QueE [Aquificota bacterium]